MYYDIKEIDIFTDRGGNESLARAFPKKNHYFSVQSNIECFLFLGLHSSCVQVRKGDKSDSAWAVPPSTISLSTIIKHMKLFST